MDLIYLDNAATTRAYKEIDEVISNFNQNLYFNPSALYKPSESKLTSTVFTKS